MAEICSCKYINWGNIFVSVVDFFSLKVYIHFTGICKIQIDDQKKGPYDFFVEVLWNKFRFRFLQPIKSDELSVKMSAINVKEENMTVKILTSLADKNDFQDSAT